jgi:putative hydrolase of the HAD superfamily
MMASPTGHLPKVIFLDALGTLVALEDPSPALVRLLRERHGLTVGEADARRAMHAEMTHYRNECGRAADSDSLAALRLECAQIVLDALGEAPAAPPAEQLVPTLLDALRFDVFADVTAALEGWRGQGRRLFVVSNWDISLHEVLRQTGLDRAVDGVISSAQAGFSKPDPRIFAAALKLARCRADEALHIGDSLDEDVAGAHAAGIEAVLLARGNRGEAAPDGVRMIASLLEL